VAHRTAGPVTAADPGRRELVHASPHAALRPHVLSYEGYREHGLAPFVMREVPRGFAVLIIGFGPPFTVGLDDRSGLAGAPSHRSFFAGLHDLPALVRSSGRSCCMQVNLTPLGAARLLGATLGELANRVVALDEVLGQAAGTLADRLWEAGDWAPRFALLEGWIRARLVVRPKQKIPAYDRFLSPQRCTLCVPVWVPSVSVRPLATSLCERYWG
jgi:hypothetical protein